MTASKFKYLLFFLSLISLARCNDNVSNLSKKETDEALNSNQKEPSSNKNKFSGVMMQGFYWNVPKDGKWWNIIKSKVPELSDMTDGYGIDRIWLPPAYKAQSGAQSMGYDPFDYYDLGNFQQSGTTETRFGSKKELKTAIQALKNHQIKVMEDIVLNHRSGGTYEANSAAGDSTYTDFSRVKSGKATWHWNNFHPNPNPNHQADPGVFAGFPDVCYHTSPVTTDIKQWLNWLKNNIGFNGGWRFDYVKGLEPGVITKMKHATGNAFSIGEYFDGNETTLNNWINSTQSDQTPAASAFDFALYFTMVDIFNKQDGSGYLPDLVDPSHSLAAQRPLKAVTFAGNHDTDKIVHNKMMAYAFILTYQGYPTIWWKDYFNYHLDKSAGKWGNGIDQLVWVRGKLVVGSPKIELLKANDGNLLMYEAKGISETAPGYIVVINDQAAGWKGATVQTNDEYLKDHILKTYAWHSSINDQNVQPDATYCDTNGNVQLYAPPRGYAIYSVDGL